MTSTEPEHRAKVKPVGPISHRSALTYPGVHFSNLRGVAPDHIGPFPHFSPYRLTSLPPMKQPHISNLYLGARTETALPRASPISHHQRGPAQPSSTSSPMEGRRR